MNVNVKGLATNLIVTIGFVLVVWWGRAWFESQEVGWDNIQFTLQAAVPVILVAAFVAVHEEWIRIRWVRFVAAVAVIGALLWWYNGLVVPADYVWSDGIPVLIALLVLLTTGVGVLAWAKPYLAGWPLWR